MEEITIYFSKPYQNNGIWQAGTTTSIPSDGGFYKYKVKVKLPREILDIQELEEAVAESEANEQAQ